MSALVEGIRQSKAPTFLVDGEELRLVVMSTHHLDHFLRPRLGVDDDRIGPLDADARIGVIFPMPVLGPENAVHHARLETPRRRKVMRCLEWLRKSSGAHAPDHLTAPPRGDDAVRGDGGNSGPATPGNPENFSELVAQDS